MKLLKPLWVNHGKGNPIFSIDIHPDGSRFVTGGQGDNCGRIIIWNMSPLSNKDDEYNENIPKQLCKLDNHLSCVNCVRWSNSGKYLASAGDDKIIMIWQFAGQGGAVFGGVTNAESWRSLSMLRGHNGDILDLNWSPNDNYLATCSVDNTVRIWNAERFPECLKILTGHTGFVKGVSWDPMGKFLSTQSDDKSLKIWRTSDWKEEVSIIKPFIDCGGTTHVLRLNWCPNGQFLVSAHSMNNLASTAQIITREKWDTEKDFVGHRKAVTCLRFCPRVLYKINSKSKKEKKEHYFCVAIGSRDRSLSVWLTSRTRPLFVMHDLFNESILDVSWSKDGYKLLACSWDGTVGYFEFDEQELGKALDDEEVTSYLHKIYGRDMKSMQKKTTPTMFIEDVEMMKLRENNENQNNSQRNYLHQNGNLNNFNRSSNLNENTNSNTSRLSKGSTDKQIETKTIDGKRRIIPLYIPPVTNCDGTPIPFNVSQQIIFSSSNVASKIQVEKVVDSVNSSASLLSQPSPDKRSEDSNKQKDKQPQTPISKESMNEISKKINSSNQKSSSSNNQKDKNVNKQLNNSTVDKQPDKNKTTANNNLLNSTNKKTDLTTIQPAPIKQVPTLSMPPTTVNNDKRLPDKSTTKEYKNLFTNLYTPKIDKVLSRSLNNLSEDSKFKGCSLVVDNNLNNSDLCSLRLVDEDQNKLWQVLVSQKILIVSNSDEIVCIGCEDNSVHVFNLNSGRRLSTPFLISSTISKLTSYKHKILIITIKAELWLWDMKQLKVIAKNVSLIPLLQNNFNQTDINITNYCITSNNQPLITLSTGKTYIYDLGMETWHLLSNNQDLLNYSCDYKQKIQNNVSDYPLSLIQSQQRYLRQIHNVFLANRSLQPKATLSYIDQQLASSYQLASSKEYRHWLIVLAQFLTDEGQETRFKELCEFLLGPVFARSNSNWEPKILDIDKRELLKDVLLISTSNLNLQRIYNEYKEQLDQVNQLDNEVIKN